jgi:hypothetical protein
MKNILFAILQFVLFLFLFAAGSLLGPIFLHLPSVVTTYANGTRGFQWDGVFLMLALFVVILLIEAIRKRLRYAAGWTSLALVLAAVVGLVMKIGFLSFEV